MKAKWAEGEKINRESERTNSKAKHKETEDSSEGERVPGCICGGLSRNLREINFRNPGGLE